MVKQDKAGMGLGEFGMATMKMKLSTGRNVTSLQKGSILMPDSYFVKIFRTMLMPFPFNAQ